MPTKAPNRKRAVEYLRASGAVPISIIERDSVCSIHAGKISGTVAARWWLNARDAPRVATDARSLAGRDPDVSAASAAVARSAAVLKATLTPDDVAIARAGAAVTRLDEMIEAMRKDGTLQQFNTRYKAGRTAALAKGRGFMGYGVAMARLKRSLIPRLIGRSDAPMQGLFEEVFR